MALAQGEMIFVGRIHSHHRYRLGFGLVRDCVEVAHVDEMGFDHELPGDFPAFDDRVKGKVADSDIDIENTFDHSCRSSHSLYCICHCSLRMFQVLWSGCHIRRRRNVRGKKLFLACWTC